MKHLTIIFIFCGLSACSQTSWSNGRLARFGTLLQPAYLTITTGQSNSISGVRNIAASFTSNPNLSKHFDSTNSTFPVYVNSTFAGGFETQTAGLQGVIRADTIYQVRVGEGSQDIYQWSKTDQAHLWINLKRNIDSSLAVIRRLGKRPVPLSVIWLQGEQNVVVATSQATYQAKLDSLIDNIRALDPTLSAVQFVMVKLRADQTYSVNPVTPVNDAFDYLASHKTNCVTIDPTALGATLVDAAHYTNGGYILIANQWSVLINNAYP